jgi:hypothetical protein
MPGTCRAAALHWQPASSRAALTAALRLSLGLGPSTVTVTGRRRLDSASPGSDSESESRSAGPARATRNHGGTVPWHSGWQRRPTPRSGWHVTRWAGAGAGT